MRIMSWKLSTLYKAGAMNDLVKQMMKMMMIIMIIIIIIIIPRAVN
jgi:hypothetical protein